MKTRIQTKQDVSPETTSAALAHAVNELGLLTSADFCRMMKVSSRTEQRWRALGAVPFVNVRGKVYYRIQDLRNFLDQHVFRNAPKRTGK